jgi:hypothetical protein
MIFFSTNCDCAYVHDDFIFIFANCNYKNVLTKFLFLHSVITKCSFMMKFFANCDCRNACNGFDILQIANARILHMNFFFFLQIVILRMFIKISNYDCVNLQDESKCNACYGNHILPN